MLYSRKAKWISSLSDTLGENVDWSWLKSERHISSSGVTNPSRPLSPDCMDIFVQLCIDLGTRASIIVALDTSANEMRNQPGKSPRQSYRKGSFENAVLGI